MEHAFVALCHNGTMSGLNEKESREDAAVIKSN